MKIRKVIDEYLDFKYDDRNEDVEIEINTNVEQKYKNKIEELYSILGNKMEMKISEY